jgi:YceI-like domain
MRSALAISLTRIRESRATPLRHVTLLAAIAVVASACVPPSVRIEAASQAPPDAFPADEYRGAIGRDEPVYRIDPAQSLIVIEVRRGGTLAAAGHDHVVASHDVQGLIAERDGRADIYVPLDRLVVDEPALRSEAGFEAPIPDAAVVATRVNMLNRVLHADAHPWALVHVSALDADHVAAATMTINGISRSMPIPIAIELRGDDLRVTGSFAIEQTDFGITPLSLFNGAIQVQNQVGIRLSIQAQRVKLPPLSSNADATIGTAASFAQSNLRYS